MNALDFAIKMELDGEKYYREQAEIHKDNSLRIVCLLLADDEKKHASMLSKLLHDTCDELIIDGSTYTNIKNIFNEAGAIRLEDKENIGQLDFYRIVIDMEKQSIDLYTELLAKATNTKEEMLFHFLIEQEKQHHEVFEELALLLQQADEWVESAEFGIRKDY